MKKLIPSLLAFATVMIALFPAVIAGQRRRVVVRPARVVVRHPVRRTAVVVHRGHPLRRVLPAAVVVRPARRAVVVGAPLVYLPSLVWRPTLVLLPAGDRLVWQDSESITRYEDWVDTNFGVDSHGNALFLDINGKARLNFAEITFANGNVQVMDFNERTHSTGVYRLLDFADGRHVKTVRMLAKSESDETKLAVYLSK
ncbi:MAG: hypothetical protein ABI596_07270 [Pyrinomonadaceae bacterium]